MTGSDESSLETLDVAPGRQRRVRVDAKRNIDLLLQAAAEEFARAGVEVPIRDIAEKAGVGVATLYRHFPTRTDLIVAVFRKEVADCVAAISSLLTSFQPGEALFRWVESYVDFIASHRGLAAALNSGDPALEGLPAYFLAQLGPSIRLLLDGAAKAGDIRGGIEPHELTHSVAMLCVPPHCGEATDPQRMVGLFMDGLRFGAEGARATDADPCPSQDVC